MTIVANDTFTAANGTDITSRNSDSGHSWTTAPGSTGAVTIQSNAAVDAVFNGPLLYSSYTPPSADYSVFMTMVVDAAGNYVGGPAGRIDTATGTCYSVYWNGGAGEWRLDTTTSIGTYTGDTPTTAKIVELRMAGSSIKVLIDGVERISVTDTTYTSAGRPGGYFVGGAATRTHDNWQVDVAAGGGTPVPVFLHNLQQQGIA